MTERPILFSGPMVRAILDGSKTQTRRVVKAQPHAGVRLSPLCPSGLEDGHGRALTCAYGWPGDGLWVRETHAIVPRTAYACSDGVHQVLRPNDDHDAAVFREGWTRSAPGRWRPSIHMPRWASRIDLLIQSVRVERLHEISDVDSIAEGVDRTNTSIAGYARQRYMTLWEQINGAGSWEANPWVWVVEFERIAK